MTHESNTQAVSFPPPKHKGQKQYRLKLFMFHNTVFVKRNYYYCHVCPSVCMDEHHSASSLTVGHALVHLHSAYLSFRDPR